MSSDTEKTIAAAAERHRNWGRWGDDDERGTPAEFVKLRDAILDYYAARNLWFDDAGFLSDFNLLLALE